MLVLCVADQSGLSHMVEILQHANDIMHSGGIVGFPVSMLMYIYDASTFQLSKVINLFP